MAAFTTVQDLRGRSYEFVPDGVYFDLPEQLYFAQDALGSSDLVRLWKHKHGWWWSSRWNPDFAEKPAGRERIYGRGCHAIVLEGVPTYERKFAVMPEKPAVGLYTIGDVKARLSAEGFSLAGTSSWSAGDWFAAARDNLPLVPCWPNMMADFEAEELAIAGPGGELRQALTPVEDRMLRVMHRAAMEDPGIAKLFGTESGFPPLAEVSVLRTDATGIRRRWRFDRLFPQFTLDLKTLGNWEGRPLKFAVGDHIGRGGYDIQRADYDVGRGALYDFVRDGFQVDGGTVEQRHFLKLMVEAGGNWDWVWMFYQKPELSGRAPVIFPVYDDNDSDLKKYGRAKATNAVAFYRQAVEKFGLLEPWTHVEELHYTSPAAYPNISFPHWIEEDEPPEDPAAYELEEAARYG